MSPRAPSASDEMPKEHQELLEKIKKRVEREMEPLHKQYRDHWDDLNGVYFNYDKLRTRWRDAKGKDSDGSAARGVLLDARRDWGGHLIIPYAYATTETVVPRVIANAPRFIAKALKSEAEERKAVIQDAVNQQLSDIDLELKLNPVARRACKLGLGVAFTYWQEEKRQVVQWGRNLVGQKVPKQTTVTGRKGAQVEDVDIYDWLWDPSAKSIETCQDILYRTWRPFSYIKEKVESGEWLKVDLDAVEKMGRGEKRTSLWAGRNEAQGFSTNASEGSDSDVGRVHEVWQYFTRDRVVTILDEALIVQDDVSPFFHRELPFQIYRPTPVEGQLPGLGVIDAIRDLIDELSTMRTQRRDAATYKLNPPTFYSRGMIERRHMKTGPGVWVPVTGDIKEAVWQPPMGDLPGSAYTEEDRLKADIEMTSGVSDPIAGGSGADTPGAETATGIQLLQAAANVRIGLMARLMLLETLKPFGRQVLELNRQHQIEGEEIRVADQQSPEGYRFETIAPEDWQLPLELVPEEHSNEPENRPSKISEATQLYQNTQGDPNVNPQERLRFLLEAYGVRDADAWLIGQVQLDPQMAAVVGESLKGTLTELLGDEERAEVVAMEAMEAAMEATGVTPEPGGEADQGEPVAEEAAA